MKTVHVVLVSDQPIPNLTTLLQFRPDLALLLYTSDMGSQKDRLQSVLKARQIAVESREILPYDLNNVIGVCEKIINDYRESDISLNITGGTKIGTMGAFQVFYSGDKPIYYVNTRDNEILKVAPDSQCITIDAKIGIKDYLAAYGFMMTGHTVDDSRILKRREASKHLVEAAMANERIIGLLNAAVPDTKGMTFPRDITLPYVPEIRQMAQMLEAAGMLKVKGTAVTVETPEIVQYLRGFWFEEYVYTTARSIGADEVKLNVTGTWDASVKNSPTNEFDVMISKGTRLACISCKTSDPNRTKDGDGEGIGKEFLYELDSLSDNALGLFGKRMIASVRKISNDYVRDRAKIMKIDLIDGRNIRTLKETLQSWLNR